MLKIDGWGELKGKFDGIAIIGNAPCALDFKIGPSIDAHDCTIRMNNYVVSEEFAPFIGFKTDVFVTNCFPLELGKSEEYLLNNGVKMIWASISKSDYLSQWPRYLAHVERMFGRYDVLVPSHADIVAVTPMDDARLNRWLRRLLLGHGELVPSTGLVAIAMALKLEPRKMLISGFDFFSSKQAYYFSPNALAKDWGLTHHRFDKEPSVIARLVAAHPEVQFELAVNSDDAAILGLKRCANVRFVLPAERTS